MTLRSAMRDIKEKLRLSAQDMSRPGARFRAQLHYMIFDHAFLRMIWHNFSEIAPGVFRSNQPSPARLRQLSDMGIRTVLNLRGASDAPHYVFEQQACQALGLTLVNLKGLSARSAPPASAIIAILDAMRDAEKPFVFHCKSGADRSSLAAALYLLAVEKAPLGAARKQFSPRFIHFKWTKTGVLDHILDSYEQARHKTGITFEDWLRTEYDANDVQTALTDAAHDD